MGMQRYLLVLDTDLAVTDEEPIRGAVADLAAGHGREPPEVVVVSMVSGPRGQPWSFSWERGYLLAPWFRCCLVRRGQGTTSVPPPSAGCTRWCSS